MRPDNKVEKSIQEKLNFTAGSTLRNRMLNDVLASYERGLKRQSALAVPNNKWHMKNSLVKITVVATLLVGLFLCGSYLLSRKTQSNTPPVQTTNLPHQDNQKDTIRPQIRLASEMETAKQLFEKNDVPGLMRLLQTGEDPTKLQIANYLGQIGDNSVLSTLRRLAEQWHGPITDNPFQEAIETIQSRQADSKPEPQATSANQEPNTPQVSSSKEQTGVKGFVIDKITSQPIPVSRVGFSLNEMVTTNTKGGFQLIYEKSYEQARVYAAAPGYASKRIVVHMNKGSMQDVSIELNPGSKLVGVITDPSGQPIQGAKVGIFGLTNRAAPIVTREEGRFEIDGLDPLVYSYQIHVTHPAYPSVSVGFTPRPAGQTQTLNIVLKPGVSVFGRVTNSQGLPVAGVTVGNTRSRAMWNNITVKTDQEGRYRLDNLDIGELVLWTVHDQYAPFVNYTSLAKDQAEQRIDIQLTEPRTLRGRVVDSSNNPVPEATVVTDEYNGVRNLDQNRYSCDSEGRFIIPNAPQKGSLILRVFGEDIAGAEHQVDFSQDECVITVERSGRIYGQVVDNTTGEPITTFLVKMTATKAGSPVYGFSANWIDEGRTFDSAQGWFDTGREPLPIHAQMQMTVIAEGFDPLTIDPVMVQPISEDPNRSEFRLQSTRVYAGRVINSDDQPIQGATVVFFSDRNVQYRESWPQAVTDETGIFTISGLGNEPHCMSVSASGFTPRAYLMENLLDTSNYFSDIVLEQAATLVGYVLDENGEGIAGASVHAFVDIGEAREVLTHYPSLGPRVRTDSEGHYQLTDVPTGERISISAMSPSNYQLGHKTVALAPGESMALNFGDEGGYVIAGTVRAGEETLEGARVTINAIQSTSENRYFNNRRTDVEGRFRFIHVPKGQCMIFVNWEPRYVSTDTQWPAETKFEWRHSVEVKSNMDIDIDLVDGSINGIGGGSISGLVPQIFQSNEGLSISVIQQTTSAPETTEKQWQLTSVPDVNIDADGRFFITHVPEGRHYLVLRDAERTLAFSEIFEMSDANPIDGIYFHHGNGRLLIRIIDAKTGRKVPNAMFSVRTDLRTPFMDQRFIRDKTYRVMTVDDNGQCLYDGLPDGQYQIKAQGHGYLTSQSTWADVTDDQETELVVRLIPAAMIRFDLSEDVREQISTDKVLVSCLVTEPTTQTQVKQIWPSGESDRHNAIISLSNPEENVYSVFHLPAGTYDLEYRITAFDVVDGVQAGPGQNVATGNTTVTCQIGQITSILITEQ